MSSADAVARLQALLERLERAQAELERSEDAERAIDVLGELADLARQVQDEVERARRDAGDAPA